MYKCMKFYKYITEKPNLDYTIELYIVISYVPVLTICSYACIHTYMIGINEHSNKSCYDKQMNTTCMLHIHTYLANRKLH